MCVKYIKVLLVLLGLLGVVILFNAINLLLRDTNLVLYEDYVAENNNNKIVYEYVYDDFNLILRWLNENVSEGPYYLLIYIDVENENIENVYIDDIEIITSNGKEYHFSEIKNKPFLIYNINKNETNIEYDEENKKSRYYYFKDRFDFDFDGNETFKLKMSLSYEGDNIKKDKEIEVNYIPYLKKIYAPIL